MALYRLVVGERQSVMHQFGPRANAPQRRRPDHVPGASAAVLYDPIARPDVVQQEVTERADSFITEFRRDPECAAVNQCAGRGGDYGGCVTDCAPYLIKQRLAATDCVVDGAAARRPCGSHEISERLHIGAVVLRISDLIKSRDRSAQRVVFHRPSVTVKGIGDPHFVEVGVSGERYQTGMLVLPPGTSDAQIVVSFDHRNLDDGPLEGCGLVIPDVYEGAIGDALHEAIADYVKSRAESPDVFQRGVVQALLDGGGNGPQLNQRLSARRIDKSAHGQVAGPQFTDLADAATLRVLVAVGATRRIIGGPEPVLRGFKLIKDEFVILERAVRNRLSFALVYWRAPGAKPIEQVVSEHVQVGRRSFLYINETFDRIR